MSFTIKGDGVLHKHNKILNKIKKLLNIQLHGLPVYDEIFMKAKVRKFNGVIKTNFLGNEISKESVHCACIACITIYILLCG